MDEVSRFYAAQDQHAGTHLALRWKGRVRYIVPREMAGQQACWKVFRPGMLGMPLRAKACLPRLLGSVNCIESDKLALVREAIGKAAGLSCWRAGAPGPWSKETILLLEKKTVKPLYLVKAGGNAAVNSLLDNEANWLRKLHEQPSLSDHVPELVAHRPGDDLSFIVQRALSGNLEFRLGEPQVEFLRRLQEFSIQSICYEDSKLFRTLNSRLANLNGHLTEAWSTRFKKGLQRIEQELSGSPILFVGAHNDFTPWNIRVARDTARVFDWEYADDEQLPLFDPLHFTLMPMALKSRPTGNMVQAMHKALQLCQRELGADRCCNAETQALAYLVNLCTLYLSGNHEAIDSDPIILSYARLIDHICGA